MEGLLLRCDKGERRRRPDLSHTCAVAKLLLRKSAAAVVTPEIIDTEEEAEEASSPSCSMNEKFP